jgi:hypothetical protein
MYIIHKQKLIYSLYIIAIYFILVNNELPEFYILITFFSLILFSFSNMIVKKNYEVIIILLVHVQLLYGMLLGFLSGYPLDYVLKNSGGLFSSLVVYYLIKKYSKSDFEWFMTNITILAGLISLLVMMFAVLGRRYDLPLWLTGFTFGSGIEGSYRVYGVYLFIACISIPILLTSSKDFLLARLTLPFSFVIAKYRAILGICIIFAFLILAFTKSSILVVIFILMYVMKKSPKFSVIFVISFVAIATLLFDNLSLYVENVRYAFSMQGSGNEKRIEDISNIINNTSFFGQGNGAPYDFKPNSDFPYSSELSYLNLFHKYGFASLPFMLLILHAFLKVFFLRNHNTSILAGSMLYLFPSIGNPILFHPVFLCMFILSYYHCGQRDEQ